MICSERAPAKLNLHLHVTGRRGDGYHELDTSFALIDWFDEVCVSRREDGDIRRLAEPCGIPLDADLAVRAARLLRQQCEHEGKACPGADLLVRKSIPLGAGLGGGSSNAASILRLLNRLWGLHWPLDRLAQLGATLGADVPVFVHREHARAQGIGERLWPMPLSGANFVLVFPRVNVATAAIFTDPELTRSSEALKIEGLISWESLLLSRNDLQPVTLQRFPEVGTALDMLREAALRLGLPQHWPRMSGSGSTVFSMVRSVSEGLHLRGLLQSMCAQANALNWVLKCASSTP